MKVFKRAILLFLTGQLLSFYSLTAQPKTITILHTNDMHAGFLPHEATWIQATPKPTIGGIKELAWTIDSLRKVHHTTFLLDAGDVMTGTPISEYVYQGVAGGALFAMMNDIGYDVWTIGNHDLDISQENLRGLMGIAKFPTISANLTDSTGQLILGNKPYVIIERDGMKIGVIGIMSRDLFQLTNTNNLKGLMVGSPVATAQKYVDSLQSKTDLIVALTHEGVDDDSVLAASTHGINVIIGGHSHTRLKTPKSINGVLVCQTGSNCEYVGELNLTVENHSVVSSDGKLIPLWTSHQSSDSPVAKLVDDVKQAIDKDFNEVIGSLVADWKRNSRGESNIGDFIADAICQTANAQVGITNSSGIRKDQSSGPIRKVDLFEIMPFRNIVCTFTINGKDLREFSERYMLSLIDGRSPLQLSGLTCVWKRIDGKPTIVTLNAAGKEIADDQSYLCATSDFVVNQGDKYLGFQPQHVQYLSATVYQAMVDKVRHDKTINSQIEDRFKEQH
jgi:5'-nucleotidase/UDP-sugar diphosphatase